jgi:hypothetical protein
VTDFADSAPPPVSEPRRLRLPAEYYDAPPGPPALPRGLKLGCGIASLVLLVVAFGGAAVLASYGINKIFAFAVDRSHDDLAGMYGKDVPPAKRKQVDKAIDDLSKDLAADRVQFSRLQPLLEKMKDAMDDKVVTNREADELLKTVADARKPLPKK